MSTNKMNLKKVNFDFNVQMVGYTNVSSEVVLSEIPWKIKIFEQKDDNETVIKAALICSSPNKFNNQKWKCEAMAAVSTSAYDKNGQNYNIYIPKTQFENKCLSSEVVEVFRAFDLAPSGIVFNIRLFVNPVFYETSSSQIDLMLTKFRLNVCAINQVEEDKDYTSPDIILSRTTWTVDVVKQQNNIGVYLRHKNCDENGSWSWNVKFSVNLLSFNENVQPVTMSFNEDFYGHYFSSWGFQNFISWTELMDPAKKYVENNMAVFEIHLEIDLPTPLWNYDGKNLEANISECSICLKDIQSPAATKCGHLFCIGCIRQSVDRHMKCPNCNAEAKQDDIRPIFL